MKLSKFLTKSASDLISQSPEAEAVRLLVSTGMAEEDARLHVAQVSMEKIATTSLVEQGINYDEALRLVKSANINIKDLQNYQIEKTPEELMADVLLKAAEEVKTLEDKVAKLEKLASELDAAKSKISELEAILENTPEITEVPEPISKLASTGAFSNEDLEALRKLPSQTLTKVAHTQEQPTRMGRPAGVAAESLDPLTRFLLDS